LHRLSCLALKNRVFLLLLSTSLNGKWGTVVIRRHLRFRWRTISISSLINERGGK